MKNYETPKIEIIEFETTDIIQTSGLTLGNEGTVGGDPTIFGLRNSSNLGNYNIGE